MRNILAKVVATGGAVAVMVLGPTSVALANTTININPGNVPTTAAAFPTKECSANLGGGPFADQDVWVFNLPGNHNITGDFVKVTATFQQGTRTIPTDGGEIVLIGTSKAFIALPAGWTLTGATAEITGTADQFVLTHTCPAGFKPPTSKAPTKPGQSKSALPVTGPSSSTLIPLATLGGLILLGGVAMTLVSRRHKMEQ